MKMVHALFAFTVLALAAPSIRAEEGDKPGPEMEMLKKMTGNWETTMKFGEAEAKGTQTYKMELGGLWLVGSMESDLGGMKFTGKSMDSYDAKKKKIVSVWFDSMSSSPLVMEGNYDPKTKTVTLVGEHEGMDGKVAKWKSISKMTDENTVDFQMFVGDGKDPMFSVIYKRKK